MTVRRPSNRSPRPSRPHCPLCQGRVRRVHRRLADHLLPSRRQTLRFSCRSAECGWHGLLRPTSTAWVPPASSGQGLRWGTAVVAVAVLGTALAQALPLLLALWPSGTSVAAGVSHDGVPLPASHPLAQAGERLAAASGPASGAARAGVPMAAGLTLRQHCSWGQPGRNPYQGTPEQALTAARLPPEVVQQIAQAIRSGEATDQLTITRDGIQNSSGSRRFAAAPFVMTYGRTLCLNARVNFAPGHSEPASLFEASDQRGRRYAVMVPSVCGNVSVIGETTAGRHTALSSGVPYSRDPAGGSDVASADDEPLQRVNAVPVPGTLWLVLAGLGAAALVRRRP